MRENYGFYDREYPHKVNEILPLPEGKQMPHLFCDEREVKHRFGDRLWTPTT
jgi:hypothetical protein